MRTIGLVFASKAPAEKYVCPECGKEYKSESALAKHLQDKHLQDKHSDDGVPKTEQESDE